GCLLVTLGSKNLGLTAPLCFEDLRLLRSLSREDRRAAVTLGTHLLLHRVLDAHRRIDRLELDAGDADAPFARRLVEHGSETGVDLVAARERLFEVEATDDVTQRRRRQLLDGPQVVRDL